MLHGYLYGSSIPSFLHPSNGALLILPQSVHQGKMKEAEEMYLRALTGYEKTQGLEHTTTLDVVIHLGILYDNQDRMKEAEEMYLRVLTGYRKAWVLSMNRF